MGTDRIIAVDLLGLVMADVVMKALSSRARRRFIHQRRAAIHRVRSKVEVFVGATGIVLGALTYIVVRRRAASSVREEPERIDGPASSGAPALTV